MSSGFNNNRNSDGTFEYLAGTGSSSYDQYKAGVGWHDDQSTAAWKVWEQDMKSRGLSPYSSGGGGGGGGSGALGVLVAALYVGIILLPFWLLKLLIPTSLSRALVYPAIVLIAWTSGSLLGGAWLESWHYERNGYALSEVYLSDFVLNGNYDHWLGVTDSLSRVLLGSSPGVSHAFFEAWPFIALAALIPLMVLVTWDVAATIKQRKAEPKDVPSPRRNFFVRQWHSISRTPPFAWWLAVMCLIVVNAKAGWGEILPTGYWKAPSVKEIVQASSAAAGELKLARIEARNAKALPMPENALQVTGAKVRVATGSFKGGRSADQFAAALIIRPFIKNSVVGFERWRPCGLRVGTPQAISGGSAIVPVVLARNEIDGQEDCLASLHLWWNDISVTPLLSMARVEVIPLDEARRLLGAN